MNKSYDLFLALHLYSICVSGFLMLVYLVLTQGSFKTEFIFIKRIRLFLPLYYLFLAIVLFTGSLLLALNHFATNLYSWSMIIAWILIFALAIFHFIQFKKARKSKRYTFFRLLSFIILILEFILLFLPSFLKVYL